MAVTKINSVKDIFESNSKRRGADIFIVNGQTQEIITYERFFYDLNLARSYLKNLGITPGDRVVLLSESDYLGYLLIVTALTLSIKVSPLNITSKTEEIDYALGLIKPKHVFYGRAFGKNTSIISDIQSRYQVTMINENQIFNIETKGQSQDQLTVNGHESGIIIFTTGSTGRSKGVELTVANILSNIIDVVDFYHINSNSKLISYFPLSTIGSTVINLLGTAYVGASVFLCQPFLGQTVFFKFIKEFWEVIESNRITHIYANPTILNMLLKFNKDYPKFHWTPEMIISSMAPLPKGTQNGIEDQTGIPVLNGYGLTETTCRSLFGTYEKEKRRNCSLGRPVYPTKIVNEYDGSCGVGEIGEIIISGPTVMKGYYNDPEATNKVMKDGWFYTGDLGYYDEDGFFYIVGRKKNIIIKNGNKISVEEIEEELQLLRGITDYAVVGVPDVLAGEKIVMFYTSGADKLPNLEIVDFCQKKFNDYSCPDRIIEIDKIPRSASGKVLREELKRYYCELERKNE